MCNAATDNGLINPLQRSFKQCLKQGLTEGCADSVSESKQLQFVRRQRTAQIQAAKEQARASYFWALGINQTPLNILHRQREIQVSH